jgi:hypothetical protein
MKDEDTTESKKNWVLSSLRSNPHQDNIAKGTSTVVRNVFFVLKMRQSSTYSSNARLPYHPSSFGLVSTM